MMQFSLLGSRHRPLPEGQPVRNLSVPARRLPAAAAIAGLAVGVVAAGGGAPAGAAPSADAVAPAASARRVLGDHDLKLLAEAEAKGEKRVTILVAAGKGRAATVGAELAELGGTVAKRVDAVGYVRASVPTAAVLRAAAVPGVAAVDLNEVMRQPDPSAGS